MKAKRIVPLLILVGAAAWGIRAVGLARTPDLVLTGIVTTRDVTVSSLVPGRIDSLAVDAGDPVEKGEVLALISSAELESDVDYYAHSAEALGQQVSSRESDVAAAEAEDAEARANLERARQTLDRHEAVASVGGLAQETLDQARSAYTVAEARADMAARRVSAARSALEAAKQQWHAATAQAAKADVRLGYSEVRAPIDGVVDVRAARAGEVVSMGQPIVTLVDPDDLWVRADVEESYVDRIRLGDTLTVRLPSGDERAGRVFFRGVDADFATQRDVSRTKRDIRTFEIRLRVDNTDRELALGMTAYVLLPAPPSRP